MLYMYINFYQRNQNNSKISYKMYCIKTFVTNSIFKIAL